MADVDETKEQQKQQGSEAEKSEKKSLIGRLLPWIVPVVVVTLCVGAGFGLGRLFAGPGTPDAAGADAKTDESTQADYLEADSGSTNGSEEVWYYDLDPVVANLDEPTVSRYVRASLTLEMSSSVDKKKGAAFLDEKKPILINWLTVFLSGLSLEDIRGDKNLKSIQSRILEGFNNKLFPDSKPQIKRVLIKEFPVQ
ncbi:MAG: flagellar basal body-associated FliL family protein [Planctomycetota bacterium]|jgi:flagellar basal body-associated protein FliL